MQEGLQTLFPVILWTSGLALLQSWVYLDHFRVPGAGGHEVVNASTVNGKQTKDSELERPTFLSLTYHVQSLGP